MNAVLPRTIETQRRYIIEQAQKRLGKVPVNCECEELTDMPELEDFEEIEEMIDIVVKDSIESLTTIDTPVVNNKRKRIKSIVKNNPIGKICIKCGATAITKEEIDILFHNDRSRPDDKDVYCKKCKLNYMKELYHTKDNFRQNILDHQKERFKRPEVKLKKAIRRIYNYKKNNEEIRHGSLLMKIAKTIVDVLPLYKQYPKIGIQLTHFIKIKYKEKYE